MSQAYLPSLEASLELPFTDAQHSSNLRDTHELSFPGVVFHLLVKKGLRKDVTVLSGLNLQVV
jgi:hypothetical protein